MSRVPVGIRKSASRQNESEVGRGDPPSVHQPMPEEPGPARRLDGCPALIRFAQSRTLTIM